MIAAHHYPTIDGQVVTIRPIRITDAGMEADFVRALSPQSRHFRFLGGIKELSPQQVKMFCEVDGKYSMAFVATVVEQGKEVQIGVSRYAANSKDNTREMAVTVADKWQKKGLGKLLLKQLIEFAKGHGITQLYSIGMANNTAMRELAADLGMAVTTDPDDSGRVLYSLPL
jgi:GNAT superfamily N-acetyltransferase